METVYKISSGLFEELTSNLDCTKIINGNSYAFIYDGKLLVPVMSFSFRSVVCYEVVPIELYKGDLEPMYSGQHHIEVNKGNRERGYPGQITKVNNKEHVFLKTKYSFEPSGEEGKQQTLF